MADERPWTRPLHDILRVEAVRDDVFTAQLEGFGGVILGCATLAAALTCPERALHSLHTYFLRPVPENAAVELAVERLRDGRRFAHRRVQLRMADRVLCDVVASFTHPGAGLEYQEAHIGSDVPPPEALPTEEEVARADGMSLEGPGPFGGPLEWRWIGSPWRLETPAAQSRYRAWVRPRFSLPQSREFNAAALAFLSDYHSHFAVARKLGGHFDTFGFTSLDQVLWLHRDCLWDEWWLLTTESDIAHAGRAFTRRLLHARDGRLIASMAQEQLIPDPVGSAA